MTSLISRVLSLAKVNFAPLHRQPSLSRLFVASLTAIGASLLCDALLVAIGERVFPATSHYVHFQFSDYARLTIVGVVIACVAWPIVTRISPEPRWLFFRLAIIVTAVLLIPDAWILYQGSSGQAVTVLVLMHVAIAIVTYYALVLIARVQPGHAAPQRDERH